MRYGFVMAYGDARAAAELAAMTEEHGWDGFFVWESVWGIDAWAMLAAAAMTTERIRLGTMLTPLPRRKPWDVAGQTSTVDNLSNGRVTLAVGLGVAGEERFWLFEDDPGRKVARRVDGRLARDAAAPVAGSAVRVRREALPIEEGRRPDAAARRRHRCSSRGSRPGWWAHGRDRSRCDERRCRTAGCRTTRRSSSRGEEPGEWSPELLAEGVAWLREERAAHGLTMDGYDVVAEGTTTADDPKAAETVRPWAEAGATWWIDADWSSMDATEVRVNAERRLKAGPPRIA